LSRLEKNNEERGLGQKKASKRKKRTFSAVLKGAVLGEKETFSLKRGRVGDSIPLGGVIWGAITGRGRGGPFSMDLDEWE